MRKLYVIGIGAGDPGHLTLQAVTAMNVAEVFFLLGKASAGQLSDVRKRMLDTHRREPYRIVEIPDPPRDRRPDDYRGVVEEWHERRAERLAAAFADEDDDTVGAILVWGDPSLYDSTLRIVERVLARGTVAIDYVVIPGVTSVSALAARARTVLHDIGEPLLITTGRKLREEGPRDGATVVMLDADCSFADLSPDTRIWWAAYLGLPDETVITGRVGDVAEHIRRTRAELRARNGWIMDIYLLRR